MSCEHLRVANEATFRPYVRWQQQCRANAREWEDRAHEAIGRGERELADALYAQAELECRGLA